MGEIEVTFSKKEVETTVFFTDSQLAQAALHHLDFLKEIDSIRSLRDLKVINNAIYRYEKLWLPLAAAHPDEILMPPLDVHWCWHCHLLAPVIYKRDCLKLVGCEINHRLVSEEERSILREKAEALWRVAYPDEPFDIDLSNTDVPGREEFKSDLEYNVELATTRQKTFYYNVSLPHYRNAGFLQRSVVRYKKFLFLRKAITGQFFVPYYDQDLMWHTHQLFPQHYANDTTAYHGRVFHHDDTDGGDRSVDGKLVVANKATKRIWKDTFKEVQDQPGTCYRGGIRHHDLYPITTDDLAVFNIGSDVVFSVDGPPLDDFRKKLCEAITTADSTEYILKHGDVAVGCKVQFITNRNVLFTILLNEKPVIIGRNISNYEVATPRQVSDGPGSGVVMVSREGDIGMVIVDATGDWSVSKINKVAAMWPGRISTWYHWDDAIMIDETEDSERSKYSLDLQEKEIRLHYDDWMIHRLAAAFVDLVLTEWPEIGRTPVARVVTDTVTNKCDIL